MACIFVTLISCWVSYFGFKVCCCCCWSWSCGCCCFGTGCWMGGGGLDRSTVSDSFSGSERRRPEENIYHWIELIDETLELTFSFNINFLWKTGEKPCLRQKTYDQEVVGSNPNTVYWIDVSDLLNITLKKNWEIKVAKWGTQKNNFYEKQ